MILEVAAVLLLVHCLSMLSRLIARWRDVSYYISRPDPRRASRSSYGDDAPLSSPSVMADRHRREAGAAGAEAMGRKPPGLHHRERPHARMFRPCKRPPIGLRITAGP